MNRNREALLLCLRKNTDEHFREGNSIKNQLKSWYEMLIPH